MPGGTASSDVVVAGVTEGSAVVQFTLPSSAHLDALKTQANTGVVFSKTLLGFGYPGCVSLVPSALYTAFPPELKVGGSGFSNDLSSGQRDNLVLKVMSPKVSTRSTLSFFIGNCSMTVPAPTVSSSTTCMESYTASLNWKDMWTNDCANYVVTSSGNSWEYTLDLNAQYTETVQFNKRQLDRVITETLGFKILLPKTVTVTTANQTLAAPPALNFRAMVLGRSFDLQTNKARVTIRTKLSSPWTLKTTPGFSVTSDDLSHK